MRMRMVGIWVEKAWMLDAVPFLVLLSIILLIALHLLALVYWIYRLSTDNKVQVQVQVQEQRRKAH
ncbi:hypothetical protein TanjilG_01276 [Lupinus angustifolius]|uniref:Uncharacterized protein n=1 Tax=Lupinus angustifolius TaxID=3871 RepID=A0A4P1REU3_LUPAN|nr:hypothetical protein TanjilG_01276 [Lupinus angustifolius]